MPNCTDGRRHAGGLFTASADDNICCFCFLSGKMGTTGSNPRRPRTNLQPGRVARRRDAESSSVCVALNRPSVYFLPPKPRTRTRTQRHAVAAASSFLFFIIIAPPHHHFISTPPALLLPFGFLPVRPGRCRQVRCKLSRVG